MRNSIIVSPDFVRVEFPRSEPLAAVEPQRLCRESEFRSLEDFGILRNMRRINPLQDVAHFEFCHSDTENLPGFPEMSRARLRACGSRLDRSRSHF